jgi:arsenite methyltransferase
MPDQAALPRVLANNGLMSAAFVDPAAPTPPDLASHFERIVTDRQLKAGRALAVAMGIAPGCSVLDLGCGTGLLSEHLAQLVGMQGDVLGLDPSPYHMAIAYQRSRPNLRFQVGSPQDLSRFPAGCFDAIVANGLLHTWPDHLGPLRELHRVLKPGGRLGLVTHSAEHPHPVRVVEAAVLARVPYAAHAVPEALRENPVSAMGLRALLDQAGFASFEVEEQADEHVHATAHAALAYVEALAWGQFLKHLPESPMNLRAAARAEVAQGLERLRTHDGIRYRGLRLQAVASKALA